MMYALALLTFDFDATLDGNKKEHEEVLWIIHNAVVRAYRDADPTLFATEHFDQFAIYFEMMKTLPRGKQLVEQVLGCIPNSSGPAGHVPSRMHAVTVTTMIEFLQQNESPEYNCFHEFSGLGGVFPVDSAVYFGNTLVALVEVDGERHYKQNWEQLRRKDQLKEHLYRFHYPGIPMYRLRNDQLDVLGYKRGGEALAMWIAKERKKEIKY